MTEGLFSSVSKKDVLLIALLLIVPTIVTHLWISDRLGVLRTLYPVQVSVVKVTGRCSTAAPSWMPKLLRYSTKIKASPANQLVYLDPQGQLHHCENGWSGSMLRSPRLDANTRFRFASVSKVFVADAILRLVEEGEIGLETKLLELWPDLPPLRDHRLEQITIQMLLQHSAGFDRLRSEDPLFRFNHKPWCPYNMAALSEIELDFDPGERQSYSNIGYCLLGEVLSTVSGKPFRLYMEEAYQLSEYGIKFIDGPYLEDEVRYDFRNENFYTDKYYRLFDFQALSSSAGLSGHAVGLASAVKNMLARKDMGLLSAQLPDCDLHTFRGCYGYSLNHYKHPEHDLMLYLHGGTFPGASPFLAVDSQGGITVLLTSGVPLDGFRSNVLMYQSLYEHLLSHYESSKPAIRVGPT